MPELNKANRQVCDVDIRILSTMKPFLFFEDANTTTTGFSSDSVYAMSKGARKIAFQNPIEGTMSITGQIRPFKLFSLFTDGTIDTTAAYADKQVVTASSTTSLSVTPPDGCTIKAGTVFVYPEDSFGDEGKEIKGTWSDNTFTVASDSTDAITNGSKYIVGYIVNRTSGVKKISFNNEKLPKDYYITMKTMDKDEHGDWTAFRMVAHKAAIQRNLELSFSSEGDPSEFSISFDLTENSDGDVLDFIEIED